LERIAIGERYQLILLPVDPSIKYASGGVEGMIVYFLKFYNASTKLMF
jgi:hypothetical protein